MKQLYWIACFLCISGGLLAQTVVNRYPYVQRPTETSVTIAWRRANASTGTLYLGLQPSVWFDSISATAPIQKHFFDIAGLQSNTRYYYQVKSIAPNDTFVSAVETFYTAAPTSATNVSFLAYGDCGYNNATQNQVKDRMKLETVNFAIVTGDVDQGTGNAYDNVFFGVYKDLLKRDCHYTCIGNHDTYADNAQTYLDAFYLPHNNPASSERYYSFVWGDTKFVCLDANISYAVGSPQYNWMIEEFKCNDQKWLLVFFHQPPWTNAWSGDYYIPFTTYFRYQGNVDMRTILVPKFEQYGVDFVVNGHSHCYQRGVYNGVQYLITGGGGASTLDANTNSNSPNISVEIYENHYVRFDINGDTAKYRMINKNGVQRDSVVVIKSYQHYTPSLTSTDITCFGANNGTASISVSGPKPPYTFLWDNGQTTANATGLNPGVHDVVVTDGKGCQRVESVIINEPTPSLTLNSSSGSNILCAGSSLGLTANGAFTSYIWSTGATTQSINVTTAGTISVSATPASGCTEVASFTVIAEQMPVAVLNNITSNGLTISLSTPSPGLQVWIYGDGLRDTTVAGSINHTYASAGTYLVQLVISNACGSDTASQVVTINPSGLTNLDKAEPWKVQVMPNPFKEQCQIRFHNPHNKVLSLAIYDVQGRVLRHYTNISGNSIQIDKEELLSGNYFFLLTDGKKKQVGKLVIE